MSDLYAAAGATVLHFMLDVDAAVLTPGGSTRMPAAVQYACPHATLPVSYFACADRGPSAPGDRYTLRAVIKDADGELHPHGDLLVLPGRPIHVTVDGPARHLLVLYNKPAGLTVHPIRADGTVAAALPQAAPVQAEPYPHQVRVTPTNDQAVIVARGTSAGPGQPAEPGKLRLLSYADGRVANVGDAEFAGRDDLGSFQARHLDFHPTLPLAFVSVETQNKLAVLRLAGGRFDVEPLFTRDLLADQGNVRPRQMSGAVHVHPSGNYVYLANRADAPEGLAGGEPAGPKWLVPDVLPVLAGGENTIAVFRLDPVTSEPTLIQLEDSRGICPRTFSLDPAGRVLVAGNMKPMLVRTAGGTTSRVPVSLAVFRVAQDGTLRFAGRQDIDTGGMTMEWTGILLPDFGGALGRGGGTGRDEGVPGHVLDDHGDDPLKAVVDVRSRALGRQIGVPVQDGLGDPDVLLDGGVHPRGVAVGELTQPGLVVGEVAERRGEVDIARGLPDGVAETARHRPVLLVAVLRGVLRAELLADPGEVVADRREHGRVALAGRQPGGVRLDRLAHLEELGDAADRDVGDGRAAAGANLDQLVVFQPLQGLADRRPRNLEPLGQLGLAQHLTGYQLPLHDLLAEHCVYPVALAHPGVLSRPFWPSVYVSCMHKVP
jgi:6-phosphogluconolactonase (cycloisomerase 2 family)